MSSQKKHLMVAIDGTAGVGKTTIGQMLAEYLGCHYLDTGAMYRAVTLLAVQAGLATDNIPELVKIARTMDFKTRDATASEAMDGRQYTVLVNSEDVSKVLRSPQVEDNVSQVAAIGEVRAELVKKQRELTADQDCFVMIGRDIGSVVLPNADLKVYLDASPEVRAKRRSQQNTGDNTQTREAQQFITQRDRIDSGRSVSPLVIPSGALYINTDDLDQHQVLELIKTAINSL